MFQPKHLALVALLAVGTASASNVRVHVAHEHRQAARAAHAKTHHSQTKSWWDPASTTCSDGGQSVSVVGWPEPGCIDKGVQMCVATYSDGACPDGAECAWLSYDSTGASVYGCKPAQWHDCGETEATCADGEISVSVVGWEEPGCVYDDPDYDDDICVASYYWGACPEGSACGFVTYDANDDPVYGCYAMDLTEDGDTCVPVSVVGWEYSGCIDSEDNMCVADNSEGECPDGSSCAVVQWDDSWNPSVWGCVDDYFYDYDDTECHSVQAPCDEGYDEIGVVGWSANGCVPSGSDVCVADIYDGTCPEYSECWPVNYDDEGYYVWGCVATWDDSSSYKRLHHKKQSPVAKKNHSKQHSHGKKHKKHSHKKHSHKKHSHKH